MVRFIQNRYSCEFLYLNYFRFDFARIFSLALIFSITPLIALGLGLYFRNSCPISLDISRLMIISGSAGFVLIFLALTLAL